MSFSNHQVPSIKALATGISPSLSSAIRHWWREERRSRSAFTTLGKLIGVGCEFVRDSLPDRKRQRFGDADYDWQYRVNTTSAGVSCSARLIGLLNSPYQPMEEDLFYEMLNRLAVDFAGFTFIDIGSGKGRALLMASAYPFRRILGLELLPELNDMAQENIRRYSNPRRRCRDLQAICGDATLFDFPHEPLVVFLFHPLPKSGFRRVVENLERSWREAPRPAYFLYAHPLFEYLLAARANFRKMGGTHQYALFRVC